MEVAQLGEHWGIKLIMNEEYQHQVINFHHAAERRADELSEAEEM